MSPTRIHRHIVQDQCMSCIEVDSSFFANIFSASGQNEHRPLEKIGTLVY